MTSFISKVFGGGLAAVGIFTYLHSLGPAKLFASLPHVIVGSSMILGSPISDKTYEAIERENIGAIEKKQF